MQKSGNAKHSNYAFKCIVKIFRSLFLWLWPLIESKIQQTYSRYSLEKTLTRMPDVSNKLRIYSMFRINSVNFFRILSVFTNKRCINLHFIFLITQIVITKMVLL